MSSEKPIILLVPGSFSPASFYDAVISQLHALGFEAVGVELVTVSAPSKEPAKSMDDDAAHIHDTASRYVENGKDVIIVMHSYAGIPGSQAVKGLVKAQREADGRKGGVVGLVYLSSFIIAEGESLQSSMGAGTVGIPDFVKVDGEYMTLESKGSAATNFSDLSEKEGLKWASMMPGHALDSFAGKLNYGGYRYVPVGYLLCEGDKTLPPDFQISMIEYARSVTQSTVDVVTCSAGHCVMLSQPGKVVEVIQKVAGEA